MHDVLIWQYRLYSWQFCKLFNKKQHSGSSYDNAAHNIIDENYWIILVSLILCPKSKEASILV